MIRGLESINEFVNVMLESKDKFETVKEEFDQKNLAITQCINRFQDKINRIKNSETAIDDEEIMELYTRAVGSLNELLNQVAINMESTRKGMKFISDYEQSFNVVVFGKVKAGKSYLGNFIMGNVIRDAGIASAYDKIERPKVEVYDRGNKWSADKLEEISEEGKEEFRVDPNEATAAIQLFRLGGLTWFDTPGIGSITWENEMLAKDYVDNADLIVYTSNSDAAGTRQDFKEMKELYEKGKKFLLLLTQSDMVEEDCDDDGEIVSVLVPKSDKDRKDTEDYICHTLMENEINNLDRGKEILTVSVKLALNALIDQNEEMFKASNMDQFLHILTEITRNEGAALKLKTPNDRINAAIRAIAEQLKLADEKLQAYSQELKKKQEQLNENNELLLVQMKLECSGRIERLIRQKSREAEDARKTIKGDELADLICAEIYRVILKNCMEVFEKSEQILTEYKNKIQIQEIGDLKMRKDRIEYEERYVNRVERDPEKFSEHIFHFFGKRYYKLKMETRRKYSTIELGMNDQQIIQGARDQVECLFEEEVPRILKVVSSSVVEPMIRLQENSSICIQDTQRELEQMRC